MDEGEFLECLMVESECLGAVLGCQVKSYGILFFLVCECVLGVQNVLESNLSLLRYKWSIYTSILEPNWRCFWPFLKGGQCCQHGGYRVAVGGGLLPM